MITICMFQRKGGVGKTTIASNLAQALSLIDHKVLLIDNDPQANLTTTVGLRSSSVNMYDLYENHAYISNELLGEAIVQTFLPNLYCITGSIRMDACNPNSGAIKNILNHQVVQEILKPDIVIIDNSPAVDSKTKAAIAASNVFLVPVELEQLALVGLKNAVDMLVNVFEVNMDQILILRNVLDARNMSKAASMAVEQQYGKNVVPHSIPRAIGDIETMLDSEKSLFLSRSRAKVTGAFLDVACDLLGLDRDQVWRTILNKINAFKTSHLKPYQFKHQEAMITTA